MSALPRQWPLAAAWLLLLVLLLAVTRSYLRGTGGNVVYPLDDSYIQMAIGKNLAAHGVWGVTRHEFSGAGSSILWPLILAGANRLVGLDDRTPLVLNVLSAAALLWLARRMIARHVHNRTGQFAALALIVVATPLPVLAWVGMEHTLQALLALALADVGVRFLVAATPQERRNAFALTLAAAALTVAIRYDTASVLAALGIIAFVARGWRPAGAMLVSGTLPALSYGVEAWRHGWPPLPSSVLLKQRLLGVHGWGWHEVADVLGGGALTVLVNAPFLFALMLVALALLMTRAGDSSLETRLERECRLLLLVFLGATLIHLQFGRLGWLYRYEAYLVSLGIVANVSALGHRLSIAARNARPLQRAAAGAMAILIVFPLLLRGVQATRELIVEGEDVYRHEYQLGRFFQRYPQEGALMAGDIGAVAYFGTMPIVDPGGLATLDLIGMVRDGVYDRSLVNDVAVAHGVRLSISGSPLQGSQAWRCTAQVSPYVERRRDVTFVHAVDGAAADRVERDLRSFRDEDARHVNDVKLASELPGGRCPAAD